MISISLLESDDTHHSLCFMCNNRFLFKKSNTIFNHLLVTENDKSFVDDFDMERGIVSMRVGLSYDLLRLSLCSGDLYRKRGFSNNTSLFYLNYLAPPHKYNNTTNIITTTTIETITIFNTTTNQLYDKILV